MNILSLLAFLAITALAAATGSQFMPGPWYESLVKPSFTPPNWVFPIAWTILYTLIAIAGWRVWRVEGLKAPLVIWGIGLALNALWSYLMFGIQRIDLALIDIVGMLIAIVAFIATARGTDRLAAALFIPYLAWVSFAAVLNFSIWQLNP